MLATPGARPSGNARGDITAADEIKGQADSEVLFYLELSFGLEGDPPKAIARVIGFVEACERRQGGHLPFQGTIATTDGERLWAFRYSSEGKSRSPFFTRDVRLLRELYPDREILREVSDDARLLVSEPVGDLPGAWAEVPEASYAVANAVTTNVHRVRLLL